MRDLDEMLDPTVSRRASTAARTPDFAVVERRGWQRRRRARAMAVGSVAAVVAAVSVVGTQVASEWSDTAPAGTIEYDGPDGELAQAIESGEAELDVVTSGPDDAMLTSWYAGGGEFGFTLTVNGETHWSPLTFDEMYVYPLSADGFVVETALSEGDRTHQGYLVTASGVRGLELTSTRADLESGRYEGLAYLTGEPRGRSRIYAIDADTASAAPVVQLDGISPQAFVEFGGVRYTGDGDAWVVTQGGGQLIELGSDGRLSHFRIKAFRKGIGIPVFATISRDGRPIVFWEHWDRPSLNVSTVIDGRVVTFEYVDRREPTGTVPTGAVLPDGRLIVSTTTTLLRSTDASWRRAVDVGVPRPLARSGIRGYTLQETSGEVCLMPPQAELDAYCTTDGEAWEPVDLTL